MALPGMCDPVALERHTLRHALGSATMMAVCHAGAGAWRDDGRRSQTFGQHLEGLLGYMGYCNPDRCQMVQKSMRRSRLGSSSRQMATPGITRTWSAGVAFTLYALRGAKACRGTKAGLSGIYVHLEQVSRDHDPLYCMSVVDVNQQWPSTVGPIARPSLRTSSCSISRT